MNTRFIRFFPFLVAGALAVSACGGGATEANNTQTAGDSFTLSNDGSTENTEANASE